MDQAEKQTFSQISARLSEIAAAVDKDDISLDRALDLYDEAVKLGMKATELLEAINLDDAPAEAPDTQPVAR